VFKWIVSPLISKALGKPAKLDGQFWITCSFNDPEIDELKVVDKAAEELTRLTGGGYHQSKSSSKWKKKKFEKMNQTTEAGGAKMGVEAIL